MTLDWYEHPEAREEFLNAHERYSLIDDGRLGDEFADAAESAAELILRWPDGPPPYRGRRLLVASSERLTFTSLPGRSVAEMGFHEDWRQEPLWATPGAQRP